MGTDQPAKKDLVEVWNRIVDDTYTIEDIALILDSVKGNEHLQAYYEVSDRTWDEMLVNALPLTKEQEKECRKKVVRIIAESENNRKIQPAQIPARTIGRFRKLWYAAAAVLLFGLLIPTAYLSLKPKQIVVQYIEAVTPRGEIRTVILPDQTKVTLNAGSRIKYPDRFTGDERSVELCGEALFDVTPNPARPFTVKTENMGIRVLGTVFNVKEYEDDMVPSVSVASGKVEVNFADGKALLKPNQQVKIDKATGNFEKLIIDADKCLSWRDGALYFHRTPIREVVNILNRHYPQMDIELAEGEYSNLISGKYINVPSEDILESIIYSTGLHCKKRGNKIVLYP